MPVMCALCCMAGRAVLLFLVARTCSRYTLVVFLIMYDPARVSGVWGPPAKKKIFLLKLEFCYGVFEYFEGT
jgi:hypothetical protein